MSLFDEPKREGLSDVFPHNTLFWLLTANYEGIQPTEYGESPQAAITACPVDKLDDTKQFRVWGTLAEQISQMDENDIPAEVEVAKLGRKNIWRLSKKLDIDISNVNIAEEETPF